MSKMKKIGQLEQHLTALASLQSWTNGWRQIDKIRQNRFLYGVLQLIFLRFFTKKCQNLAFDWTAGYLTLNSSISGIFRKFPNFLRSEVLSRSATPALTFW